jgi:hypothetical protein
VFVDVSTLFSCMWLVCVCETEKGVQAFTIHIL